MQTVQVEAPACAAWCTEEHPEHGWDRVGRETVKFCRASIDAGDDADGVAVNVEISRFSDLEDGVFRVHDPEIEVRGGVKLSLGGARAVAAALTQVAGLVERTGS